MALTTKEVTNLFVNVVVETLKEVAFSTPPGKVGNLGPVSGGRVDPSRQIQPHSGRDQNEILPGFTAYVRQTR